MTAADLKQLIREEVHLALTTQLHESSFTDMFTQVHAAAMRVAKNKYRQAARFIDMDILRDNPIQPSDIAKTKSLLKKQSRRVSEAFGDDVKQFLSKLWNTLTFGGGVYTVGKYLSDTFYRWYDTSIEIIANSEVMRIFTDLGMQYSESSNWVKVALFAFFIFFVLYVLYIIGDRSLRKQMTNK